MEILGQANLKPVKKMTPEDVLHRVVDFFDLEQEANGYNWRERERLRYEIERDARKILKR